MLDLLPLIVLYAFLGGSIKFIDQAYDENAFPTRTANILAVLAGVLMGYLMAEDSPFSTAFFAAMLISLVLAKKIDNFAFATGTVLAVVSFIAFYPSSDVTFALIPAIVFLAAGFVDEIADDMVDKYDIRGPLQWFLNYRPFSDIALLGMVLVGVFPWVYFLPYYGFTFSYMFVERCSEREYSLQESVGWLRAQVRGRVRLFR
jgi:hypothetical protein